MNRYCFCPQKVASSIVSKQRIPTPHADRCVEAALEPLDPGEETRNTGAQM